MAPARPIAARRLAGFSALAVATGGFNIPLHVFLPPFYATTMGFPLRTVGLLFLCARLVAAFSDPLVGWLSDHTRTRIGRRKPWILAGGLLFLVGLIVVFNPRPTMTPAQLGVALVLLCLGWTATSTPLYAWGGELSADSRQRSRIQAYLQTAASIGIFCVLVLPAILDARHISGSHLRLEAMGLFLALMLAIGLPLIAWCYREPALSPPKKTADVANGLKALVTDTTLWRIVASDFFVTAGQGARGAVFVFFVSQYMHLGIASLLLLLQYAFGILASPIWARISHRLGRVRTLLLAEGVQVIVNLSLLLVLPTRLSLLVGLTIAQGLAQGSGNLMLRAIIYDVADRHTERSGVVRAGLLSSVFNVTTNAAMAVSISIAFLILAQFGFQPAGPNNSQALSALALFFALGPALGHAISALLIWRLPIKETTPPA